MTIIPQNKGREGGPCTPCKGLTLVEVIFVVFIGSLISGIIIMAFLQLARLNKSTSMQLLMSTKAHQVTETLERDIRRACNISVSEDGFNLTLTFAQDANSDGVYEYSNLYYRYQNTDGNHLTIKDNTLVMDPDMNLNNGNEKIMLRYITPLPKISSGFEEIFTIDSLRGAVVNIRFRVGDSALIPSGDQVAITGPGYQGVQIVTQAIPRNTQLY